jgi:RNA polymerase sigma-70 factor (ECF subfamily)
MRNILPQKNVYKGIVEEFKDKTDNELVLLIRQNPEFLSYIIDRYKAKLERYIDRRTNISNHDREDILQDIFIKIYRNINEYDDSLIFSSWVYRITYNYMIDWHRKNKKHIGVSLDAEDSKIVHILEDENMNPETYFIHGSENLDLIKKEIQNLPISYKEILMLKFFDDKSYEEISDILKISISSVGVKINRAKKLLKEKINI